MYSLRSDLQSENYYNLLLIRFLPIAIVDNKFKRLKITSSMMYRCVVNNFFQGNNINNSARSV